MGLKEEIENYREPTWGMVSNSINPMPESWDNPMLFTAQYCNMTNVPSPPTAMQFLFKCVLSKNVWLSRWPDTDRETSQDELTGLAVLSPGSSEYVLTELPFKYRRFLYLVPFLKACTKKGMNILDKIIWSCVTISSTLPEYHDTSGKCLTWVQLRAVKKRNYWICNMAIKFWQRRMMKQYPGGLKELFGIYFPGHPLADYAPSNFDL